MNNTSKPSCAYERTSKQRDLQAKLTKAIHDAIPIEGELDKIEQRVQVYYRTIAELLVDLRHEFPGPNGEPHDLKGRSSSYRIAVREAYGTAGADLHSPIPKRLTVGVAYWVRKILLERYGEEALYENGGICRTIVKGDRCPDPNDRKVEGLPKDPANRLEMLIGMLNSLAVDPRLDPSEAAVRAAFRAVMLLRNRLNDDARSRAEKALLG